MNLTEIKEAVEAGKSVYWNDGGYVVVKDAPNKWLIVRTNNRDSVGLVLPDGTLNGKEDEFFTEPAKNPFLDHATK